MKNSLKYSNLVFQKEKQQKKTENFFDVENFYNLSHFFEKKASSSLLQNPKFC